jgi:hypothetical protein
VLRVERKGNGGAHRAPLQPTALSVSSTGSFSTKAVLRKTHGEVFRKIGNDAMAGANCLSVMVCGKCETVSHFRKNVKSAHECFFWDFLPQRHGEFQIGDLKFQNGMAALCRDAATTVCTSPFHREKF